MLAGTKLRIRRSFIGGHLRPAGCANQLPSVNALTRTPVDASDVRILQAFPGLRRPRVAAARHRAHTPGPKPGKGAKGNGCGRVVFSGAIFGFLFLFRGSPRGEPPASLTVAASEKR